MYVVNYLYINHCLFFDDKMYVFSFTIQSACKVNQNKSFFKKNIYVVISFFVITKLLFIFVR